jgi:hypothetical protein
MAVALRHSLGQHEPTHAHAPVLAVEKRAAERATFDADRQHRTEEAERLAVYKAALAVDAEIKRIRAESVFKALPLDPRIFENPALGGNGTGATSTATHRVHAVTIPKSPALATKARAAMHAMEKIEPFSFDMSAPMSTRLTNDFASVGASAKRAVSAGKGGRDLPSTSAAPSLLSKTQTVTGTGTTMGPARRVL